MSGKTSTFSCTYLLRIHNYSIWIKSDPRSAPYFSIATQGSELHVSWDIFFPNRSPFFTYHLLPMHNTFHWCYHSTTVVTIALLLCIPMLSLIEWTEKWSFLEIWQNLVVARILWTARLLSFVRNEHRYILILLTWWVSVYSLTWKLEVYSELCIQR